MRGNLGDGDFLAGFVGSIPACAGEPPARCPAAHRREVYPRVCGGTTIGNNYLSGYLGLSPRVRGNRDLLFIIQLEAVSIPACAGEPVSVPVTLPSLSVYPRVCGGTGRDFHIRLVGQGLSPRVRGNHSASPLPVLPARSIPACAGEPRGHRDGGRRRGSIPACAGEPGRRRHKPGRT